VIGAGDQRGADHGRRLLRLHGPGARECLLDRVLQLLRLGGHAGEQVHDAPPGLGHVARPEVEGQRIARGDERQHRLRAVDEREVRGVARAGDDVQRSIEDVGFERTGPDQGRHFLERPGARELGRIQPAVVELSIGDEGDGRLEDRDAPAQRVCGGLLRIPALLGANAQALDVFARVAALTRLARNRLRTDVAAAHVRIERGAAHPESFRRLPRVDPLRFPGHMLIIRSMLTCICTDRRLGS
jgi:hypothetical protein